MSFDLPLRGCGLCPVLAGTMQWDLGRARVSHTLVGVPPTSRGGSFQHRLVVHHEPQKPSARRRGRQPRRLRSRSQSHRAGLAVRMQSEKGSAIVPVALLGVSPNGWCGRFHSSYGAPMRVLPARRRDADESGRDDRAPHLQLHRSGLVVMSVNPVL